MTSWNFSRIAKQNIIWSHLQDFIQKLIRPNVDQNIISKQTSKHGEEDSVTSGLDMMMVMMMMVMTMMMMTMLPQGWI